MSKGPRNWFQPAGKELCCNDAAKFAVIEELRRRYGQSAFADHPEFTTQSIDGELRVIVDCVAHSDGHRARIICVCLLAIQAGQWRVRQLTIPDGGLKRLIHAADSRRPPLREAHRVLAFIH